MSFEIMEVNCIVQILSLLQLCEELLPDVAAILSDQTPFWVMHNLKSTSQNLPPGMPMTLFFGQNLTVMIHSHLKQTDKETLWIQMEVQLLCY